MSRNIEIFLAALVSVAFAVIVIGIITMFSDGEFTCEEWGHVPVSVEGGDPFCVPWEDVLELEVGS